MASINSSSVMSFASPSTITMVCSFPDTIISISESSICDRVGLMTNSPSIRPTRTVAIGPLKGISEIINAADAPKPASVSAIFSPSLDNTVIMTCVSHLKDFGKRGRIGRSVNRLVNISCSDGRASRLKKPPGIFPPA